MQNTEIVVGCEVEAFLAKDNGNKEIELVEPKPLGYPADEMGFLIEFRSIASSDITAVIKSIYDQLIDAKHQAQSNGMKLLIEDRMYYHKDWVDQIAEKYQVYDFTDFTENIYGHNESLHLGFSKHNGGYMLHSGLHVHLSIHDLETKKKLIIPEVTINNIVKRMDANYKRDIEIAGRTPGEWEPKEVSEYGDLYRFEYRSLPCSTDLFRALPMARDICRQEMELWNPKRKNGSKL